MKGEHRYLWKENYQKQFKNVRMIGILYNLLTAKLYNYFIKIDCLIRFYGEIRKITFLRFEYQGKKSAMK